MNGFGYSPKKAEDIRQLRFNKNNDDWLKFRNELPYRVGTLTTIENWSSFTGWSKGSATTLNSTGEAGILISAVDGGNTASTKTFDGALPIGKNFVLPIEVDNIDNLDFVVLLLATDAGLASYYQFSISKNSSDLKTGINLVTINRGKFDATGTPDWSSITTMRLRVYANTGKTVNVKVGHIQTYDTDALCTVWFDDAGATQYTEGYTYMKTKGMVGAISAIGSLVSGADFMTTNQIKTVLKDGWEIVNHTYTHENFQDIDADKIDYNVAKGLEYSLAIGAGRGAFHLVPPQGSITADSNKIAEKYAISQRCLAGTVNTLPVISPYRLASKSVLNTTAVATVQGWIDKAIADGSWLILLFHYIRTPADDATEVLPADFQSIIDYLDTNKASIKTVTVSEALCAY